MSEERHTELICGLEHSGYLTSLRKENAELKRLIRWIILTNEANHDCYPWTIGDEQRNPDEVKQILKIVEGE